MMYCLAYGDKPVSLSVYWAALAQGGNSQMLELVQGWGRTAKSTALADWLEKVQESFRKKGTRHTEYSQISGKEFGCLDAGSKCRLGDGGNHACQTSSTGPVSHLRKPQRDLRQPNSAGQFCQENVLHLLLIHSMMFFQRSQRWSACLPGCTVTPLHPLASPSLPGPLPQSLPAPSSLSPLK